MSYEKYLPIALEVERKSGIPAPIILGQAMLESGSGLNSGLVKVANNLYGIKGSGSAGSVYLPTKEEINGKLVTVNAAFRKYFSPEESMTDYARILQLPRYQKYLTSATTLEDFAKGIKSGGYATDSSYVSKLLGVIKDNGLDKIGTGYVFGSYGANLDNPISDLTPTNTNWGQDLMSNALSTGSRFVVILLLLILGIIFFMKAFEDVAQSGVDTVAGVVGTVAKPVKAINEVRKKVKKS